MSCSRDKPEMYYLSISINLYPLPGPVKLSLTKKLVCIMQAILQVALYECFRLAEVDLFG